MPLRSRADVVFCFPFLAVPGAFGGRHFCGLGSMIGTVRLPGTINQYKGTNTRQRRRRVYEANRSTVSGKYSTLKRVVRDQQILYQYDATLHDTPKRNGRITQQD